MLTVALFILIFAIVLEFITLLTVRKRIGFSSSLSKTIVEQEEEFYVVTKLLNRAVLPVNYMRITMNMPKEVMPDIEALKQGIRGEARMQETMLHNKLTCSAYLMPCQSLTRNIPVSASKRGSFSFPGTLIQGGDFLGLTIRDMVYTKPMEVVALPKINRVSEVERLLGGYLGDASVRRFIMEDPVLTIGYRDYTGREPMKAISWTHTARMGALLVKNYDYTLEAAAAVLVNVERTVQKHEGNVREYDDAIESCYSVTRYICEQLEEKGIKYCLRSNISTPGAKTQLDYVADGLGYTHIMSILEGLGRAVYQKTIPFTDILSAAAQKAEQGRSYIIVTITIKEEYKEYLQRLEAASGIRVLVVEVDKLCC